MAWIYKLSERDEKVLEKDMSGQTEKEGVILGLENKWALPSIATGLSFHRGSLSWLLRRSGRTEKQGIFRNSHLLNL